MNIICKSFLFRQLNISSKSFTLSIQSSRLEKVNFKCLNLKMKMKIALYHNDKIITKFKSRESLFRKRVGYWLLTCSGMVYFAVTLGGITRLTESGLSMVTWKLLGEKIPFDEVSWLDEFDKYKKFPEFKMNNKNISLQEFKQIWLMEYIHRMWGRFIGIIFILPAGYFWMKDMLKPGMKKKILVLGALIGCQGFLGWYMVKSGLERDFNSPLEIPRVSQYRLAAHLGLAIIIYSKLLYSALDHLIPVQNILKSKITHQNLKPLRRFRLLAHTPILKNFTENPATVQFNHRILAMVSLFVVTSMGIISQKFRLPGRASSAIVAVLSTAYIQVTLGILTLFSYVSTHYAALHQSGSLMLLSTIVWLCHELKCIKKLVK